MFFLIQIVGSVEALRHWGPRSSQMDTPFQLKMIPASINLQKTSRQVVRTHPPMVLLVFSLIINLPFLLSEKAYLLSSHEGPFYSVRGPRNSQMDAPFQLKMIPASINLQKTSGQVVRTHPPMVLLAFFLIINLPFLLSEKAYLLSSHEGPFYSVRSSVPFNGGKTFWLVMMALR